MRSRWMVPVIFTNVDGDESREDRYVYADDEDEAAIKAEADVWEENPGADIFADAEQAVRL